MKLRIGIAGTGFAAMKHLSAFEKREDAEVIGMCAFSNQEKLGLICREYQITAFADLDEMLVKGRPDAVVLCSATVGHYEQILRTAAAGVSLLVEKPVVGELQQYQKVRRAVEQNHVRLFPAHNFVYRRGVQKMKELLEQRAPGDIIHSSFISSVLLEDEAVQGWRSRRESAFGGALMDSGHHLIYQMLYLLGVPARLQAYTAKLRLHALEDEDTAQLNMQMGDGSLCVVMQSWAADAGSADGIRILGTEGELLLTDALYQNGERLCGVESYEETFERQADAFLAYLRGEQEPLSTLEDSEHTLQIINAAYRSAAEGSVYRTKWHG